MKLTGTNIPDVILIEPKLFADGRGFFLETYHQGKFAEQGFAATFAQDNHSRSMRGVLRGLHYQLAPAQGKLMRVTRGEIYDVAVDIRQGSATFGKWVGATLNDENLLSMYIPPGFAHGFCVLSEVADVYYKCTEFYNPQQERTLAWNDPQLAIEWPIREPLLSEKDQRGHNLAEAELPQL